MPTLPILMYHKVQAVPQDAGYLGNYVLPDQFEGHLSALAGWGYTPITIEQWADIRSGRRKSPKRPIAITFDDGYQSVYDHAWPALKRRGMAATVFLVADCIGETNRWDTSEPQVPLIGPAGIAEMRAGGIRFGSHTSTHRSLIDISPTQAIEELSRSRVQLEALLGEPVVTLAYPYNKQNRQVRVLARNAGYRAAVLGRGRMNAGWTNPWMLRRIKVDLETTVELLERHFARLKWFAGI